MAADILGIDLVAGEEIAILETAKGEITLRFYPDVAPNHVENFKSLAKSGFFDGTRFHRVIPGFVIQGGDPYTKDVSDSYRWGTGGPDERVRAEFNDRPHLRGVLSMARSQDPHSAGSQFFICHDDARSLDNQYTVFGCTIEGMDAVDEIVKTPTRDRNGSVVPDEAVELIRVRIEPYAG